MKIFKKAKRGFTLVELVVVIAVIAILAAVSVGAYFGVTESANKSKLEQESKQFHTAIQTVALVGNENHTLSADGLRVSDIDKFELALEESMGQDVEVLNSDPTYIAKQTIVLKTSELVKSEEGAPVVYKTFEYYTAEISGKKIAVDVVTGDFAHTNTDVVIDKDGADVTASTLYFKAPEFAHDVYAYLWGGEGDNKVENAAYPGVKINTFAKVLDIWAFDSSTIYDHVKLSWQVGQYNTPGDSGDIALPATDANTPYYENGWKALPNIANGSTTGKTVYINEWPNEEKLYAYAYTFNGEENSEWPGDEMTIDTERMDKMASYTFTKDYYIVIFNNGSDAKKTINIELKNVNFDETDFYDIENNTWTTRPDDVQPPVVETRTVYFAKPSWITEETPKMYAYAWTNETESNPKVENAVWPGVEMAKDTEKDWLYSISIDATLENLIFNNNSAQTKDIDFTNYNAEEGKVYYDEQIKDWATIPEEEPSATYTQIGIVGVNDNWNEDIVFDTTDGVTYTKSIDLEAGSQFKFRKDGAWTTSWNMKSISTNTDNALSGGTSDSDNIIVEKTGTFNFTFILGENNSANISFTFILKTFTFTVVPTPADATVTLTANEAAQENNSITAAKGTVVTWTVEKDGYYSQNGTATLNENITKEVTLTLIPEVKATYTFTVTPTPSDATVTLTAEGYEQVNNSITVEEGTMVKWSVSKDEYISQEGTELVAGDINKEITLLEVPVTITDGYYLVGTMNGWQNALNDPKTLVNQYKLIAKGSEYVITLDVKANDEFKIVKVSNSNIVTWFAGNNNASGTNKSDTVEKGDNIKILKNANITIYFTDYESADNAAKYWINVN